VLVLAVVSVILGIYPKLVTDYLFPLLGSLISP